ncbi:EAL domain-containing protein [Ancylobacter lacus]|uniref:EAL domain-containing protein n=1 Tax=Ancylobacter lacus TaxID=2579970 RepID=UPI001BD009AA|nr:EAL domain-containing protein [Ancylobacter lacus]MBS7541064.1 EAL domain-containing protein [Ancylobacter lacus]
MGRACAGCETAPLDFDFTMFFQPIVDTRHDRVWGYEALVRGTDGQSAASVLARVDETNRYRFDQACRVKAIELAVERLPPGPARLTLNFQPGAVYEPLACIRTTLETAARVDFDPRRIVFEFTENEPMRDVGHVERIIATYRQLGFTTAIDDFGAGHAGLGLLCALSPDMVKVDMSIIRGIDSAPRRQAVLRAILGLARELDIRVLAEGVEEAGECGFLAQAGVDLMQGYLFGRPQARPPHAVTVPPQA